MIVERATRAKAPLPGASPPATTKLPPKKRRVRRVVSRIVSRGVVVLFAIVIVVAVVLVSRTAPVAVETEKAVRGPMRVTIDDDGRTRVRDRFVVSSPVAGTLERIQLRAGDAIERGAVLARVAPLDPVPLDERTRATTEARIAAAEDALARARAEKTRAEGTKAFADRELANSRALAASGAISPEALDRAELEGRVRTQELASADFATKVAEHEVEQARAALRLATRKASPRDVVEIRAPAAGRVLRVVQESEGPVQPASPLVEIGDPAALEVVVDVLTSDAVQIAPGARVTLDRWGGEPLSGHVRLVEPSAFTKLSALGVEEQRVRVLVDVDDPRDRWATLGDGWRVEARIGVWEGQSVLRVPASAAFRIGDRWAVYVVEGGVARVRDVELGRRGALDVEVRKGVAEGAEVIVHPSDRVTDGARVTAR